MNPAWNRFVTGCRDRYGVGTLATARAAGVAPATFYRRTDGEGWRQPYPRVRIAPWVEPSPLTDLSALMHAAGPTAAASGWTAAWLYGLVDRPPRRFQLAVTSTARPPRWLPADVRRSRWLRAGDRAIAKRLVTLAPEAMIITLAAEPATSLRALVIDAQHRGLLEVTQVGDRLAEIGPVTGRASLARLLWELRDRRSESIFHDLVLDELTKRGYRPARQAASIETPDGRGAHPDIPLAWCRVAVEVDGDRFHRTRSQRAADRRKASQYAGSGWLVLQLDWWEWTSDRGHFLAALDAAILAQVRNGVVPAAALPAHLRGHS